MSSNSGASIWQSKSATNALRIQIQLQATSESVLRHAVELVAWSVGELKNRVVGKR